MSRRLVVVCALIVSLALASPLHAQNIASVVDAAWLIANLSDPDIVVVDLRRDADYRAGHLRGAVNIDPATAGLRPQGANGLPRLPTPEEFAARMSILGIASTQKIVLVSRGEGFMDVATATDHFWLFKRMGHADVVILDEGFKGLAAIPGGFIDQSIPGRAPTAYATSAPLVSGIEIAGVREGRPGLVLVDGRLRGQFVGINKTPIIPRYGTIPGSRSLPANWVTVDAGGRFRTADDLRAILKFTGVPEGGPIVVFGNTSLAGSLVWFALRVILGNRDVRLYHAGMLEWSQDPGNRLDVLRDNGQVQRP
ncbi:MAG: rhodanese-like domain-containing protein [Proteobacteria bacterium]|nr:rhodanese-like domain-containing protein [Pseudomonadota bacterium]MDA1059841.1 rhodanese-like domain-containing protein [Pseudomonadota bacterium]